MSYETFPITPEFVWVEQASYNTLKTEFESGHVQLRAKWPKARRRWILNWNTATPDEAEQLRAFARDMLGAATPFWYETVDKIPRPYSAPVASQVSGGSLAQEAQRVCGFTWSDSSGNETQISLNTDTITPSANYYLTVTVPEFPANVDQAYVYVGISEEDISSLKKQTTPITTSGGTLTLSDSPDGYNTSGDEPPSANSLSETVLVHFGNDLIQVDKIHATWYTMHCELEELFE